ncbi:MAG: hypothetical protein ACRYGG_02570 [Janthinobacterium lividum]
MLNNRSGVAPSDTTRDHAQICGAAGIDATRFPLVRLPARVATGHPFGWCGALSHLLTLGRPFVLIASPAAAPDASNALGDQAPADSRGVDAANAAEEEASDAAPGSDTDRTERRVIGLWLTSRRNDLSRLCRGLVVIEPDVRRRVETRDAWGHYRELGGVRICVISQAGLADDLARVLLHRHDASPSPSPSPRENRRGDGRYLPVQSTAASSPVRSPRSKSGA